MQLLSMWRLTDTLNIGYTLGWPSLRNGHDRCDQSHAERITYDPFYYEYADVHADCFVMPGLYIFVKHADVQPDTS